MKILRLCKRSLVVPFTRQSFLLGMILAFCTGLLVFMAVTIHELSRQLNLVLNIHGCGGQNESVTCMQDLQSRVTLLIKQRNELSRQANSLMMQRNQLQCASVKAATTATTGGWCSEAVKTQHVADDTLIGALKTFLAGKKVGSFGDGPGQYKRRLQAFVASYDAFDGAPFSENITNGTVQAELLSLLADAQLHMKPPPYFQHLDLSMPQFGLPIYDWVMSLEVAEHIPAEFERYFLDNVVRHAREGVIMSWAVPGQGGYGHINNRPLEYVEARMRSLCFHRNVAESNHLKNSSYLPWFQQNINVYRRLTSVCEVDASMA